MRQRPRILLVLSASFLLWLLIPVLKAYPFDPSLSRFDLGSGLLIGICGALLVWRASKLVLISVLATLGLSVFEIGVAYAVSPVEAQESASFWLVAVFLATQLLWFGGSAKKALTQPALCWWKTPPRVKAKAPGHVRTGLGHSYVTKVLDLSSEGLLLDLKTRGSLPPAFLPGQLLELRFLLGPLSVVHCKAEVVRCTPNDLGGERYGLRIVRIRPESRNHIQRFLEQELS